LVIPFKAIRTSAPTAIDRLKKSEQLTTSPFAEPQLPTAVPLATSMTELPL
jgi:hypothetical protein